MSGQVFEGFVEKEEGKRTYQEAFDAFKQRFLVAKKSIFNTNGVSEVLTSDAVNYLITNFIENGYTGDASFIEKVQEQLINSSKEKSETTIEKAAIEILATAAWLWRLTPVNSTQNGKIRTVKEILKLAGEGFPDEKDLKVNPFFDSKIKGMAKTGTYYNTNKPNELAYIIRLFEKALQPDAELLSYVEVTKNVGITVCCDLSKERTNNKQKTRKLVKNDISSQVSDNSASVRSALLHWLAPKDYEPIISNAQKKAIQDNFSALMTVANKEVDEIPNSDLKGIRQKLGMNDDENLWDDKWQETWNPTILPAKNVIYYGAPGTGKTYRVSELIKRKTKQDTDAYIVQQFHPSFGYEEFIDGIKPTDSDSNGTIKFELVSGEFKELCIKAFKELVRAKSGKNKKEQEQAKEFYFFADEINRAELSRVFGELLLCLEEDKRLGFDDTGKLTGEKIKTQNSKLWKREHAVVVLNANGSIDFENGEDYFFGVPENLYFLGTMNDIDRSIDSFDLALRRRFKWVRKDCDYNVIAEELLGHEASDETIVEYLSDGKEKSEPKGRCQLLNSYISDTLNLGSSYELGHSYFMKIELWNGEISKAAYERLFDSEIGPLVTEYLRAEYPSGKDLEAKLKEMRSLFTEGKQ